MAMEQEKKKKFSKMKMPSKRPEMDMSELDEGAPSDQMDNMDDQAEEPEMEGSPQEEGSESPAEEAKELDSIPDEDLLAEIKKRGLMAQLSDKHSADSEDEMSY